MNILIVDIGGTHVKVFATGLEKYGKKKWRRYVADVVERLIAALEPEDVVLGGGNVHKLKKLPPGCRAGDNTNAFRGGFRLWEEARNSARPKSRFGKGARKVI
jgi:polyphosphate glucokinase